MSQCDVSTSISSAAKKEAIARSYEAGDGAGRGGATASRAVKATNGPAVQA